LRVKKTFRLPKYKKLKHNKRVGIKKIRKGKSNYMQEQTNNLYNIIGSFLGRGGAGGGGKTKKVHQN